MAKYTRKRRAGTEEELMKTLKLTLLALGAVIFVLALTLNSFGPKIGSFFLLLSKNRNQEGPSDTIPPTAPIFLQVPEATKEKKITLNGVTEAGAKVKVFVNGPEKGETTADNEGSFTFVDLELGEGTNIVFAKSIDQNDNESDKSKTFTILFDEKAPEISITSPANGAEIKNLDKRVLIQGKLNEQAEVKINGRQAVVRSDNSFELLLGVDEGNIEIKVEATDKAGNKATSSIFIKYEKTS